ncbi:hypothetical protein QOT17_002975 [Balamuthia mandrillaris]
MDGPPAARPHQDEPQVGFQDGDPDAAWDHVRLPSLQPSLGPAFVFVFVLFFDVLSFFRIYNFCLCCRSSLSPSLSPMRQMIQSCSLIMNMAQQAKHQCLNDEELGLVEVEVANLSQMCLALKSSFEGSEAQDQQASPIPQPQAHPQPVLAPTHPPDDFAPSLLRSSSAPYDLKHHDGVPVTAVSHRSTRSTDSSPTGERRLEQRLAADSATTIPPSSSSSSSSFFSSAPAVVEEGNTSSSSNNIANKPNNKLKKIKTKQKTTKFTMEKGFSPEDDERKINRRQLVQDYLRRKQKEEEADSIRKRSSLNAILN